MKPFFYLVLLFCLPFFGAAQQVPALTTDQLNARVKNGGDTTYIINFWATWCVPCLNEMPAFEALLKQVEKEKAKILLLNVDAKANANNAVRAFIKKRNITNDVFLLADKNEQEFIDRIDKSWSGALPATLFIKGTKRKFYENDFTAAGLLSAYQLMQ